jgi:DNA-binding NtrC family response regulator
VDDQFRAFRSLIRLISRDAFRTVWAPDDRRGLEYLERRKDEVGIIIVDLKSTDMGGGGFFQQARQLAPSAAVLITGPLGPFLYQGGRFYEPCGFGLKHNINDVLSSIARKLKNGRKHEKAGEEKRDIKERFGAIIGRSKGINEIYGLIDKLKTSSSTVLIQGESGVGKELIAQTIHKSSQRRKGPFVAVNCGAIPANLMESELFGHERGAFTTAFSQRKGRFEVAEGGTLFLDEISEMEKDLQVKLLRVLQEREFQRVGGNRVHRADVRIIAAASRDLKQAVKAGHFRDDLFFRLNVVPIHIPPLRERKEDIPLLFAHFFEKTAERMGKSPPILAKAAEKALYDFDYPGNVRELINIVERLIVTCPDGRVAVEDLPGEFVSGATAASGSSGLLKTLPDGGVRLDEIEKELILKTLEATGDNKTEAARMLGITRRRLYLRLSSYGLV